MKVDYPSSIEPPRPLSMVYEANPEELLLEGSISMVHLDIRAIMAVKAQNKHLYQRSIMASNYCGEHVLSIVARYRQ